MNILFVCLGNICRSPMAECIMQNIVDKNNIKNTTVDSVGLIGYHTGEAPDSRMQKAARQKGYIMQHFARKISNKDFELSDIIIGMDSDNISQLHRICPKPEYQHKIKLITEYFSKDIMYKSVPDPYYGTQKDFINVIELLENACQNIAKTIDAPMNY